MYTYNSGWTETTHQALQLGDTVGRNSLMPVAIYPPPCLTLLITAVSFVLLVITVSGHLNCTVL